jgi:hypothetical protein
MTPRLSENNARVHFLPAGACPIQGKRHVDQSYVLFALGVTRGGVNRAAAFEKLTQGMRATLLNSHDVAQLMWLLRGYRNLS